MGEVEAGGVDVEILMINRTCSIANETLTRSFLTVSQRRRTNFSLSEILPIEDGDQCLCIAIDPRIRLYTVVPSDTSTTRQNPLDFQIFSRTLAVLLEDSGLYSSTDRPPRRLVSASRCPLYLFNARWRTT